MLAESVREMLLRMSAATIDRRLQKERARYPYAGSFTSRSQCKPEQFARKRLRLLTWAFDSV